MTLTAEQILAVEAPGSVLVQAGAGTGKTHLLVSRYVHFLKQGQSPLEVVAVTFTERAASELRARIRKQVQDQSLGQTLEAELEAAPLGTLHALAARICREHPSEAGVPPDFVVMDAPQAELRSADHFESALSTLPPEVLSCLNHSQWNSVLPPLLGRSVR